MEPDLNKKIEELTLKIDAVYKSVEKMRNYFKITLWVTVAVIVLPLIGMMFVLPSFFNNYVNNLGGLGGLGL